MTWHRRGRHRRGRNGCCRGRVEHGRIEHVKRRECLREFIQLRALADAPKNAPQFKTGTHTYTKKKNWGLGEGAEERGSTYLGHDLADLLLAPVEPPLGPLKLALAPLLRLDAAVPVGVLVVLEALADGGAGAGAPQVRHGRLGEADALHGEVQTGDVGLQRADAREVDPEVFGALFRGGGGGRGGEDARRHAREGIVELLERWRGGRHDGSWRIGCCGG